MTVRSEQFRRFECSTALTPTAKHAQRTELQRDIDAWLAAGNKIQEAPPLVVHPRRQHHVSEPARAPKSDNSKPRADAYTTPALELIEKMIAAGITHEAVAERVTEEFGRPRTKKAIAALCHKMGYKSKAVGRPKRLAEQSTPEVESRVKWNQQA